MKQIAIRDAMVGLFIPMKWFSLDHQRSWYHGWRFISAIPGLFFGSTTRIELIRSEISFERYRGKRKSARWIFSKSVGNFGSSKGKVPVTKT